METFLNHVVPEVYLPHIFEQCRHMTVLVAGNHVVLPGLWQLQL